MKFLFIAFALLTLTACVTTPPKTGTSERRVPSGHSHDHGPRGAR
jgi:starvation-inducible outer membrane lipoprotein